MAIIIVVVIIGFIIGLLDYDEIAGGFLGGFLGCVIGFVFISFLCFFAWDNQPENKGGNSNPQQKVNNLCNRRRRCCCSIAVQTFESEGGKHILHSAKQAERRICCKQNVVCKPSAKYKRSKESAANKKRNNGVGRSKITKGEIQLACAVKVRSISRAYQKNKNCKVFLTYATNLTAKVCV